MDMNTSNIALGEIVLKPAMPTDAPLLLEWRNRADFRDYCTMRKQAVGLEEFLQEMSRDFSRDRHRQYVIHQGSTPVGTVFSYSLNLTDGHVFASIYVAAEHRSGAAGAKAFALFLRQLFRELDLHKIYVDVYAHNGFALKCLRHARFVEEGRFRGHRLTEGKRVDVVRLAFFRELLPELDHWLARVG